MSTALGRPIHYPDSDGNPMADNTRQFDTLTTLNMMIVFGRPRGSRGSNGSTNRLALVGSAQGFVSPRALGIDPEAL